MLINRVLQLIVTITVFAVTVGAAAHNVTVDVVDVIVQNSTMELHPRPNVRTVAHFGERPVSAVAIEEHARALLQSIVVFNEHGDRGNLMVHESAADLTLREDTRFIALSLQPVEAFGDHRRQIRLQLRDSVAGEIRNTVTLTSDGNIETIDLAAIRGEALPDEHFSTEQFRRPLLIVQQTDETLIVEWHVPATVLERFISIRTNDDPIVTADQFEPVRQAVMQWMQQQLRLRVGQRACAIDASELVLLPAGAWRIADEVAPGTEPEQLYVFHARAGIRLTVCRFELPFALHVHDGALFAASPAIDVVVMGDDQPAHRGSLTAVDRSVRCDDTGWTIGRRALPAINTDSTIIRNEAHKSEIIGREKVREESAIDH